MNKREKAIEIFAKHWTKKTGKELDDATKNHMDYCIDAILEALTEQEKPAKESEPAKEIISEIICKECGKEGDLDLEGIWCANCQKYTYSEKPAKENIDLMGQIPIISLANSMFGKPTKEEREWEVGDMVRITCQLKGHGFNDGEEVQLLKYDEKDGMWEAEGKNSFWWITTEEAILISNPR